MTNIHCAIMRQWRKANLDSMLNGYIDAALWSSSPIPTEEEEEQGITLPDDFLGFTLSDQFTLAMRKRLASVLSKRQNRVLLNAYIDAHIAHHDNPLTTVIYNDFGHDLWLTENSHGTGFWDRDYLEVFPDCTDGETLGDALTEAVQYKEGWLYLGDDGLVYIA